MKKLMIVALLVIGLSSFAQENQPEKKANKGQREQMSPEQRNQAMLDRMTTELKLDVKQQEQIKPILAEQTAKLQAMRDQRGSFKDMSAEDREALKQKRQEDKKATDAKLQAILTPEQFKKMRENEKANMDKMREARGNSGNWGNRDGGNENGGNSNRGNDNGEN